MLLISQKGTGRSAATQLLTEVRCYCEQRSFLPCMWLPSHFFLLYCGEVLTTKRDAACFHETGQLTGEQMGAPKAENWLWTSGKGWVLVAALSFASTVVMDNFQASFLPSVKEYYYTLNTVTKSMWDLVRNMLRVSPSLASFQGRLAGTLHCPPRPLLSPRLVVLRRRCLGRREQVRMCYSRSPVTPKG